jgi:hypothetical protein
VDANGHVVPSAQATVSVALATNPGGATLFGSLSQNTSSGVATFTLSLDEPGAGYELSASATGLTGATSAPFSVTGLASLAISSGNGQSAPVGTTLAQPLVVEARDSSGAPLQGITVTFSTGGGTVQPATATTNAQGLASTQWTLGLTAGPSTATASASGVPSVTFQATATPAPPVSLTFVTQPQNTYAGIPPSPGPIVAVIDAQGNVVTNPSLTITLGLDTNPGNVQLGGTFTSLAAIGEVRFASITVNTAGTYRLRASAPGVLGATSEPFTVVATASERLRFLTQPTTVAPGGTLPAIQVALLDPYGNQVPNGVAPVTVALSGNGTLSGALTVLASGGVATFSNLSIDQPGAGDTLTATSPALLAATSNGFTISTATGTKLAFLQPPVHVAPGATLPQVQVEVQDGAGLLVASSNATVTIALGANPGGSTLAGTLTQTASNGVATFSDLSLDQLGNGYTLVASATSLGNATSPAFNVSGPGVPARVEFASGPQSVTAGTVEPSFQAGVYDTSDALVTSASTTITLAIANGPPGGVLQGTTSVPTSGGLATFANILATTAGGYTISASAPGLTAGTAGFGISGAAADHISLLVPPGNVAPGVPFTPAIQAATFDPYGNLVSGPSITVGFGNNPGGGNLLGFTTVAPTFNTGIVTFPGLAIDKAGNGTTLVFTSGGLTLTSAPFNVGGAGIATGLTFSVQPSSTSAGSAVAPSVKVQFVDGLGALVTSETGTVVLEGSGTTLSGTLVATASGGVATFPNVIPGQVATGCALVAESAFVASTTSAPFNVVAGAVAKLAFQVPPGNIAPATAIAPAVQVVLLDSQGNVVPSAVNVTVVLGANPGGATLSGTTTAAAVNGIATFSDLALDKTGAGYTLVASAAGKAATSAPFNVSGAGIPGKLAFTAPPVTTPAFATLPAVVVTVEDTLGNPVSSTATISLVVSGTPERANVYGTLSQSAVNGTATFADLTISRLASKSVLVAMSPGLNPATSAPFDTVRPASTFDASLPAFAAPRRYPTPTGIQDFVVADLDGDGIPDIVATPSDGRSLYFWHGLGNGALGPLQQFATGSPWYFNTVGEHVAVGDLNGDGHPDVAVGPILSGFVFSGTPPTCVGVLLQDPVHPGNFFPPKLIDTGTYFVGLAIGDVDGDGLADIVVSSPFPLQDQLLVILQDKNNPGTFLPPVPYPSLSNGGVTLVDLDGDGLLDVVVSGQRATWLRQDPANPGTFLPPVDLLDADGVIVADVNGDGVPDLVGFSGWPIGTQQVTVLLQDPANRGTFLAPMSYDMGNGLGQLAVADWNHDGHPDLLASTSTQNTGLTLVVALQDPLAPVFGTSHYEFMGGPGSFVITDLRGDGGNDFVGNDGSIIIASEDRAHPGAHFFGEVLPNALFQLASGDVNHDGKPDIVGSSGGGVSAYLQDPTTPFSFPTEPTLVSSTDGIGGIALADMNGDGFTDIVYTDSTAGTVVVCLQSSSAPGTYLAPVSYPAGGTPGGLTVTDVDGDGIPDVLVSLAGPSLAFLKGSASSRGTLLAASVTPNVGGGGAPAVGDFDGDGAPDVALLSNGFLWILLQDPAARGTFKPAVSYPTVYYPQGSATAIDLNKDGKIDIVVSGYSNNGAQGAVGVHLGDGTGAFSSVTYYLPNAFPQNMVVADVNGDGLPDILMAEWYNGLHTLIQDPNAPGTFIDGPIYQSYVAASAIVAQDLSNDGFNDVVIGNQNGPGTNVYRNLGLAAAKAPLAAAPGTFPPPPPPPPPPPLPGISLALLTQPTNIAAGNSEPSIQVAFKDANGNTITSITSAVTIDVGANYGVALSGTTTVNAVNGVATFTGLGITLVKTGYTLVASATGLPTVQSTAFNVTPGTPSVLIIASQPSNASAGIAMTPAVVVSLYDAFGNLAPSPGLTIGLAIGTNPGSSTLGGGGPLAATTGTVTFASITLNRPGSGYTLVASVPGSPGVATATSAPFDVVPGPVASMTIAVQPTSAVSMVGISPAPQLTLFDAQGNVATNAGNGVTVALAANPSSGMLFGNTSVGPVSGVVTFPGLAIDKVGTGYTLRFSTSGAPAVTSSAFNVTPGPAASMAINVQPSSIAAATTITPAVQLTLHDAQGNVATNATGAVSVAIGSNPAGATLTGTLSAVPSNGIVTFGNLSLDKAATGYTLVFSISGAAIASNGFNVVVGPAASVRFGIQPASVAATSTFMVTVVVIDAGGNKVPTGTTSVSLALAANPAGAHLRGPLAANTVGGVARFVGMSLDVPGGPCTLAATTTLGGATSKPFQTYAAPDVLTVSLPSGTLGGLVPITYTVAQSASQPSDIVVEVDPSGTGAFKRASQAAAVPGSGPEGVQGLKTSPAGVSHVFLWNSAVDMQSLSTTNTQIRITARLGPLAGASSRVSNLSVTNGRTFNGLAAPADFAFDIDFNSDIVSCVVVADFNADGKPDVAYIAPTTPGLCVALGNGDGTFSAPMTFPDGQRPDAIAFADLNGDGILDLVLADGSTNSVLVCLGTGGGAFGPPTSYGGLSGPTAVAVGDLDGDGNLDLVVANWGIPAVSVYRGNGDGTFQAPTTVAIDFYDGAKIAVADLDGDGNLDVVVMGLHSLDVLLGNGTGALNYLPGASPAGTITPKGFQVADLDGDGIPDLVVVDQYDNQYTQPSNVYVYFGVGDGTFGAPNAYPIGLGGSDVQVADVNGDGVLDIVATASSIAYPGNITILLGDGHGGFTSSSFTCNFGLNAVRVTDVNGDSAPDVLLVTNYGASCLTVCLGDGAGGIAQDPPATALPTQSNPNPVALACGDVNGDGKLDVVVADQAANQVAVLLGNASATFQTPVTYTVGTSPFAVVLADLRGNGHLDIITANQGSNDVSVLLGSGTGAFGAAVSYAAGSTPSALAVGDIDGDGKLDIVVANQSTNTISILLGNGDGTFRAPTSLSTGGTGPVSVALADLNKDGNLDIIVGDLVSIDVAVLLGTGAGSFAAPVNYTVQSNPMPGGLVVGDLDGDGNIDVALTVAFGGTPTLAILYGTGTGTLNAAVGIVGGSSPQGIVLADLNGDGTLDIVLSNTASADISVLFNTGSRTFAPELRWVTSSVYSGCAALAVADVNGDGRLDVVSANALPSVYWGGVAFVSVDTVSVLLGK